MYYEEKLQRELMGRVEDTTDKSYHSSRESAMCSVPGEVMKFYRGKEKG